MTTNKFKPGQSGNPKGRPAGSGVIGKLRESIAEHIPEIIRKLVEQAKQGDAAAARILLERVVPPIKATDMPTPLTLPPGSLSDQGRAILAAAGAGDIAPTQAAQLLSGLGAMARLVETDELSRRLDELEKLHAKGNLK